MPASSPPPADPSITSAPSAPSTPSALASASVAPRTTGPPEARGGGRLEWLDALRGLAAAVVVFEHSLDVLFPEIRQTTGAWFDFGRYGVFVFFIVSGYIVPASLERRGSVRDFWIGRMFRLYPLWAVAAVVGVALGLTGVAWNLPQRLTDRPGISALAHLTMLQELLGTPNAIIVFWTLSYEMAFYLLVTAMFVAGAQRAGAAAGLVLAAGAAVAGALLPTWLLTARSWEGTVAAVALLMACGLLAVMSGRPGARRCGAAVLGVLALGLVTVNSRVGGMESLAILATMFAGSGVHRLQRRGERGRVRVAMVAAVPVLTVATGAALAAAGRTGPWQATGTWGWPAAVAAAWATFLIGLALHRRRFPRSLRRLGMISYSVYLLHVPVVQIIWRVTGEPGTMPWPVRLLWAFVLVAAVLVIAALAHRHIELPMQRAGRRLIRRRRAART